MTNKKYSKYEKLVAGVIETYLEACDEDELRIKFLESQGKGKHYELEEKLTNCADEDPCSSLACKKCNRDFRIEHVAKLVRLYRRYHLKAKVINWKRALNGKNRQAVRPWYVLTIIDYNRAFTAYDFPSQTDLENTKKRLYSMLNRSGFEGAIVGAFEIDFHRKEELWLPHFHLIVFPHSGNDDCIETLRNKLKKSQTCHIKDGRIPRPLMVQEVCDPIEQFSYIYKLLYAEVIDRKSFKSGGYETKKQRLEKLLFCEHLCWLDSLRLRKKMLFNYRAKGKV
ncbi:hypothetical protein L4C37_11390 [Vibrio kagoshimensis]|uniref:hypothetical protein n=1 Tax=Vibrio kagoshimensis TaxID=2910244 RepID=UPI003D1EEAFD